MKTYTITEHQLLCLLDTLNDSLQVVDEQHLLIRGCLEESIKDVKEVLAQEVAA